MHATLMVIIPKDKSLYDNLMKYCENVEEGDGSGSELIYYSNEEWDVTPGDTLEELIENYKKETGEDMDPTEYHVHNLNGYYDWYMVGGRWSGFFKSVENPSERANLGEKSWTKNKKEIPTDRMLVETDAPYLAPVPLRGKPNEPSYIIHTVKFLSKIKELSFEDLSNTTSKNFFNLFLQFF